MAHLTGIGIENFRVFKDYTEFDFAPITILTGANNSGKSSLFKVLLLLKDSFTGERLEALDFTKGSHKAGDMNNVLNNKEKPLIFYFPFKFFNSNDLAISFEFFLVNSTGKNFKSECNKLVIYDKKNSNNKKDFKPLLEISLKNETIFIDLVWFKNQIVDFYQSKIDENKLKEKVRIERAEKYLQKKGRDWSYYEDGNYTDKILFSTIFSHKTNPLERIEIEMEEEGEIEREQESNYDEEIAKKNEYTWLDFEKKVTEKKINLLESGTKNLPLGLHSNNIGLLEGLIKIDDKELLQYFERDFKKEREEEFNPIGGLQSFYALEENKLTVYDIQWKYFGTLDSNENKRLGEKIKRTFDEVNNYIKQVINELAHLVSVRGTNERIYKDNSALGEILQQLYFQNIYSHSAEVTKFANYWVKKFEIKHFDRIIIENQPDLEMALLYLQKGTDEKSKSFLIDLGFGTQQLLTILLKIVLEGVKNKIEKTYPHYSFYYEPSTLLIEEPEANLHPKYQSLLADMLIDATDKFNIQFIIETHSEYLIRKLQYWVAKGTIKPTDVALYYLNDPESENVKNGKAKQVERIEIKEDGSIEENYEKYWSGFFDESERLQREIQEAKELHRIKQEKESLEKELLKVDYKCKCLIFTEDSENEKDFSETVFYDICGFKKDETRIIYYEGKDNLYPAIISTEVIKKDKPNISYIIFHRDRDIYEGNEDLVFGDARTKIGKLNQKKQVKYYLFLTQNYDLESYFLNPNHVIELYPQLSLQEVESLILQATKSQKEEALRRLSEKFDEIRAIHKGERKTTNPLDIIKEVDKKYEENVVRYRYGKFVLQALKNLLTEKDMKKRLGGKNINLTRKTSAIQIPELQEIAKEIWN